MREDNYGPLLLELFQTTTVPVTTTEAAELVGCSKQRAYVWVEKNRGMLVGVRGQKFGGVGYMTKTNPNYTARKAHDAGASAVIEVGAVLTVESVAVVAGKVVLGVVDDRGGAANVVLDS